ncbi:MAG: FAD-binding oxidoreductase [Alkalilacustris sp.]
MDRADGLVRALGPELVLRGEAAIAPYCRDWHGDVQTGAVAVLRPRSTAEVQACVRACAALGLGIVPQGGRTGLSLGAVPDAPDAQVVISLERMDAIRAVEPEDFAVVVEAGAVLETVRQAVAAHGLLLPLSLGAQGSCRIGGNLSTNAGGLNVLRYGMAREMVLGLEVVLPCGRVFDGLSRLRKDNRGLDLKQLFLGAEGTLGIVTAAVLKLVPAPTRVATALVALADMEAAVRLFGAARRECCDLMTAFEVMPPLGLQIAREALPHLPLPLGTGHACYVLLEVAGSGRVDIDGLVQGFLEGALEAGLVLDAVVAQSVAQARALWAIREGMNEGQARRGRHLRTDVSVPLSRLAAFVAEAEAEVARALPGAVCLSYGHVGDGNVHLNVLPAPEGDAQAQITAAKEIVNAVVDLHGGSISAEHGIGRLKRPEFEARLDPVRRDLMAAIRRAVDPELRMNPGVQIELRTEASGDAS